jgi:hypothetical protein
VPVRLPGAAASGPLIQATADAALLAVPRVGRFLAAPDGGVVVDRDAGAGDADLRCFLDEPVAALAAQLHGDLVLRAAAVRIEGRALVVCGPPAAGKSALVAALAQRGHAVLADAVTRICEGPHGETPLVTGAGAEPQLWPDTAHELGLAEADGRLVRPPLPKRAYAFGAKVAVAPLAAVMALHPQVDRAHPKVEPLPGAARIQMVLGCRWHPRLAGPLGLEAGQFALAAGAAADATCVRLERPRHGARAGDLAALVEDLLG